MAHALNLTLPIKQDPETLAKLQHVKAIFAKEIQPKIDEALRESEIVHFARVLVVHDKYLQVITEYDGGPKEYTEFFRQTLPDVFATLFSLAEGAPSFDDLDEEAFFKLSQGLDLPSLGESTEGFTDAHGKSKGYLFSAYGNRTVKQMLREPEESGDDEAGSLEAV
jgi:hypothetical protein